MMMNDTAAIEIEREGGIAIVHLKGEIDLANAQMLVRALAQDLGDDDSPIVLDLTGLRYIDSAGVRLLLVTAADARSRDVPIAMACAAGSNVRRVLEFSAVSEVAPVFDSVAEAAEAVRP